MRKLFIIMLMVGILTAWLNVEAWSAPQYSGWTYLGTEGKIPVYKKTGSDNEFFCIDSDTKIYFKMYAYKEIKMKKGNEIWECREGSYDEPRDRLYCYLIVNGVNKFDECNDDNNFKDDFLFESTKKMCKRNYRKTLYTDWQKAFEFAYDNKDNGPPISPNWDNEEQKAEQSEKEIVNKLQTEFEERKQREQEVTSAKESYTGSTQSEVQSSGMEILKHRSGGCTLIITNHTVYEFEIKINGISKGTLPTRKVAKIQDLNCDGFMVEAWPQGVVTGFVSRAFQHNEKQGKTFNWNLKYKN